MLFKDKLEQLYYAVVCLEEQVRIREKCHVMLKEIDAFLKKLKLIIKRGGHEYMIADDLMVPANEMCILALKMANVRAGREIAIIEKAIDIGMCYKALDIICREIEQVRFPDASIEACFGHALSRLICRYMVIEERVKESSTVIFSPDIKYDLFLCYVNMIIIMGNSMERLV